MNKQRDGQVMGGVFLIGLAVLFLTHYWWPGIMFVIGAALLARTMSQGREWTSDREALVVLGIGVVFAVLDLFGNLLSASVLWPLVLIGVGLYLLFGRNRRWQRSNWSPRQDDTIIKSKHDDVI